MKYIKSLLALLVAVAVLQSARAETYEIDLSHSEIGFLVKHLGVNTVRGRFTQAKASVSYDGSNPQSLQAQATIQAASIDTGIKKRDDHLRSPDFFEVEKHPEIVFVSKGVTQEGEDLIMAGSLVIKGVSKDVTLRCEVNGPINSPFQEGAKIIGFSAKGKINRQDFGVGSENASDNLVGDDVRLEINFEAKSP